MKVCFEHEGNNVVITRGILSSELYINSKLCDTCNGFTNNQLKSINLKGVVDSSETVYKVCIETHFLYDLIILYCSDILIETRKVSMF